MTPVLLLLLSICTTEINSLICHECGIPGTTSCEVAKSENLLMVVNCTYGLCISTSYVTDYGKIITAKYCSRGHGDCEANKNMNKCTSCKSDFCNGEIPPCITQRKYVKNCVGNRSLTAWIVTICILLIIIMTLAFCKFYKNKQKQERLVENSSILHYSSSLASTSNPHTSIRTTDGITYTAL